MSNAIFRIFSEHLGGTMRADFIGNEGDIFYDPSQQQIWLSDGVTPGGLPIATGNVVPYILPIATTTQLGGVKIDGTTITIANGVISSSGGSGSNVNLSNVSSSIIPSANVAYTLGNSTNQWQSLYVAANTIYFGNTSFSVLANGQIVTGGNIEYITANALMTAFASLLTSGNNITLEYNANNEQWTIAGQYANGSYILPVASTSTLGGVKIDGNTIIIDGSGVISANVAAGFSNGANISVNELTVLSDIVLTNTSGASITANSDLDIYAARIQLLPQDGGNAELYGGVGDGVGNVGGDITLTGGYGINGAGPGLIAISGAQQTQPGQNGGAVSINGGVSWGGSGGNVYMSAGPANSGAHGSVHVGLSNTTEIYIGAAGANVVLVGNVSINGSNTFGGGNGSFTNGQSIIVNSIVVNGTPNAIINLDSNALISANGELVINANRTQIFPQAYANGEGALFELYGAVATGAGHTGGDIIISGGYGVGGAGPGEIIINGAQQTLPGDNGGIISINGGVSWGGSGGNVYVSAGPANSGAHGSVLIGASNTTEIYIGAAGANVVLVGNVSINGSNTFGGGGVANGANVNFNQLTVQTLLANSTISTPDNGSLTIQPASSGGAGVYTGGDISLHGGVSYTPESPLGGGSNGGSVSIRAGDAQYQSGGNVYIYAGGGNTAFYGARSGYIYMDTAQGVAGNGSIIIGPSHVAQIDIGHSNTSYKSIQNMYGTISIGATATDTVTIGNSAINVALRGNVTVNGTGIGGFSNGQSISVNNADVTGRLRATNLGAYVTYGISNTAFSGAAGYKFVEFDNSNIIDSFNAADTGIYCGSGTGTNSEFRYLHFTSETAVFQVTFSASCDGINADNDYYALIKYDTSGNPTVLGYYPISYTIDLNNTSTGHGTATVKLLSTVTSGAGEKIKLGLYTGSSGTWRSPGCSIQFTRLR